MIFLWFDFSWCAFSGWTVFRKYVSSYFVVIAGAAVFSFPSVAGLGRGARIIQTFVLLSLYVFLEINLIYGRNYQQIIPPDSYGLTGNLNGFQDSVFASFYLTDLLPLVFITAAWRATARFNTQRSRALVVLWILMLAAGCGAVASTWMFRGGFSAKLKEMHGSVAHNVCVPVAYSPFIALFYQATNADAPPTESERRIALSELARHRRFAEEYHPSTDTAASRSLALLLCESLESWPIGLRIDGIEITPCLNALIADSTVYYNPNVRTQTANGRSIDGQLLYLTGSLPHPSKIWAYSYVSNEFESLPKVMKEAGAKTYLVSGDVGSTWNQTVTSRVLGIDNLWMQERWVEICGERLQLHGEAGSSVQAVYDDELFALSSESMSRGELWLEGEKAFAMWVTHNGHSPFIFCPVEYELPPAARYPKKLRDFINTAHYVDAVVGRFVETLRSRSDSEDIVIAIVGDHEGLAGDRKQLAAAAPFVDHSEHTPLILVNSPYSGRDSVEIGQVDVYSTLLDAVGLYGRAKWKGMGKSVFDSRVRDVKPSYENAKVLLNDGIRNVSLLRL